METIVAFHIGRGGRFHNAGFKSYNGEHDIYYLMSECGHDTFVSFENYNETYKMLNDRGLVNIANLLEKSFLNEDFEEFTKKTGITIGEKIWTDCDGCFLISDEEASTGCGILNWDNDYDTDYTCFLKDCNEEELKLILNESKYNEKIIREFFDNEYEIDWDRFNGDYSALIEYHFNHDFFDIEIFYSAEE